MPSDGAVLNLTKILLSLSVRVDLVTAMIEFVILQNYAAITSL